METRHPAGKTEGPGLAGILTSVAAIASAKVYAATGDTALAALAAAGVGILGELAFTALRDKYVIPASPLNKVSGQPFKISEILETIEAELPAQAAE